MSLNLWKNLCKDPEILLEIFEKMKKEDYYPLKIHLGESRKK